MGVKNEPSTFHSSSHHFFFFMPLNIRSTAANSSRVNKRPLVSPITKHRKQLKKLLPSQMKYQQDLKKKKKASDSDDKLDILDYNVQLDFQLSESEDIMVAIDTILDNQWSEATMLHNRFHTNEAITNSLCHDDLLFLLRGMSMEAKADVLKYRRAYLSDGLVTLNQLYSIYENQGNTFVDRSVEIKSRQGLLRKFIITNASPIILRSPQKFQSGKITYGFENAEVVVKTETYLALIKKDIGQIKDNELQKAALQKFFEFISENHTSLFIAPSDKISGKELSLLVSLGYITLTSNHLNEIESHQYSISYPNCGSFLKLVNAGRSWLVKTMMKTKHHQLLEEDMFNKWEGISSTSQDISKLNNFRKPFYGYDLYWILADALGAGVVEVFNTPVGRGWQLTGKL